MVKARVYTDGVNPFEEYIFLESQLEGKPTPLMVVVNNQQRALTPVDTLEVTETEAEQIVASMQKQGVTIL